MKKLSKKVVMLAVAVIMLFSLSITAAASYKWDLEVGETFKIGFSDTPYVSSDTSVIEIRDDGGSQWSAIAVGEGSATVSGGVWMGAQQEDYVFTVYGSEDDKLADKLGLGFTLFPIMSVVVSIFIGGCFVLVFATIRKSRKLVNAMSTLATNPCQKTAEIAANEFTKTNRFAKANLSMNLGTHSSFWRDVFNNTVLPAGNINGETKEQLKQGLLHFSVSSLHNVVAVQSQEEAKEAAETFGAGGEDNVWHNLKALQGCDVYRNVKIRNGATASEIDAVIVDANKGIFLLEIKSVGGQKAADGNKYIMYNMLREDPSNQIYRHEFDFTSYFADMGIENKVKNVLVFSWPHGDERRLVIGDSFPKTGYDIITVEQLLGYLKAQSPVALSEYDRSQLAAKLKLCSGDHVIR